MIIALLKKVITFQIGLLQYMSENWAFKGLLQGLSYYWRTTGADNGTKGGVESKTVLKIRWKLSSEYLAMEDKTKLTSRAMVRAEVAKYDIIGISMERSPPSVETASSSLFLLPSRRF